MKNLKILFSIILVIVHQFWPSSTLQEAIKFLENENYGQSIKLLSSLTTKEPTNPLNFYYLGETMYKMEDYLGEICFTSGFRCTGFSTISQNLESQTILLKICGAWSYRLFFGSY